MVLGWTTFISRETKLAIGMCDNGLDTLEFAQLAIIRSYFSLFKSVIYENPTLCGIYS